MSYIANMEYETRTDINLASFEGHTFACIAVTQNDDRQRVLLLTKSQLIESIPNSSKPGNVTIRDVHQLLGLSSIKFSRAQFGVIILQFKSGVQLQYKVKNAAQCAELIKTNMMAIGISGKVTKSKSLMECIGSAEELLKKTKELEFEFSINPSIGLVQELLDALREVVERFDAANDNRYAVVIKQIQNFLMRSDVIDVLDGKSTSSAPPRSQPKATTSESPSAHENKAALSDISSIISSPETSTSALSTPYESPIKEIPPEMRISPKKRAVVKEDNNHELDELNALLGDITQQFDDLIGSIGESTAKPSTGNHEMSLDDFDDIFAVPSPLQLDK